MHSPSSTRKQQRLIFIFPVRRCDKLENGTGFKMCLCHRQGWEGTILFDAVFKIQADYIPHHRALLSPITIFVTNWFIHFQKIIQGSLLLNLLCGLFEMCFIPQAVCIHSLFTENWLLLVCRGFEWVVEMDFLSCLKWWLINEAFEHRWNSEGILKMCQGLNWQLSAFSVYQVVAGMYQTHTTKTREDLAEWESSQLFIVGAR